MQRVSLVLALSLALQACAARATAPATPPADALHTLQRELGALFASPAVEHAHWGIKIVSLADHTTIYSQNATALLVPASNQKVLTAAAAAERLGWDHRFTTRLLATGPIGPDGTLDGDLVIIGDGDPTINPRHPERWGLFDRWAAALRAQGVRVITGNVVGDDNAFAEPGWGAGWAWDDLPYGYGAPVGALQYNENQVDVMVGPGMAPGSAAIIATSPIGSGIFVVNKVATAAEGSARLVDLARIAGTRFLHVRGQIAAGAEPITLAASVHNPTEFYLEALREAFGRHGIAVAGSMTDIDELREPPKTEGNIELLVDRSPPLSEIIDVTMKWSRNGYAETLLHALSAPGDTATGTRGLETMRQTLAALGVAADGYVPRDGSGLSRYDTVSAEALTTLLTAIAASPTHAERFRATLPVAGVSGTLATRMKGTAAEGRLAAKTGSMSNIRTIAGYLTTLAGEPMVFAILVNNYRVATADIEAVMDKALVTIVEWVR